MASEINEIISVVNKLGAGKEHFSSLYDQLDPYDKKPLVFMK